MRDFIRRLTEPIAADALNTANGKEHRALKIAAYASVCILFAAQIIVVVLFHGNLISDARIFVTKAQFLAGNNLWYPSAVNLKEAYLSANGYINFLTLLFRMGLGLKAIFVSDIAFTAVILFSCVCILKKSFPDSQVHYWFMILFSLLTTFWGEAATARTELPFTALVFLGLALLFGEKKYRFIVCGMLMALANWIRPLGLAFLLGAAVVLLFRRAKGSSYLAVGAGYLCTVLLIGGFAYVQCGHFVTKATTFGYNLLMTANDDADGSYMDVFQKGDIGYLPPGKREDMIYTDYDRYYTGLSADWIREHPCEYLSQIPKKIFYLYATETYSGSTFFQNEKDTSGLGYVMELKNKILGSSKTPFTFGDFLVCFAQVWYMLILVLFAVGTVLMIKKRYWKPMIGLYIAVLAGTAITLVIVGGARYHFPYLPVFIMVAATVLQYAYRKKTAR